MSLTLVLHGPLQLAWGEHALQLRSHKARCLLVALALEARPMRREELAELLWGPGRLRNLRQAIYQLRQLAGSESWLEVSEAHLQVIDPTILPPEPSDTGTDLPFCEELLGTTVAMDDLLSRHELRLDSLLRQEQTQDLRRRLARILEVCEPPLEVLARVLECDPAALGAALEQELPAVTLRPLELAGLQARVARAWEQSDPASAAALWEAAGQGDCAALAWEKAGRLSLAAQAAASLGLRRRLALAWAEADPDAGQAWLEGLALRTQDPEAVCLAALGRGKACLTRGAFDEAQDAAEEALRTAREHGLETLVALVQPVLGQVLFLSGALQEAEPHLEEASRTGDPWARRIAHATLGAIAGKRGALESAVEHHREALRLAREQGELLASAAALNNLGGDLQRLGRVEAAGKRFGEAALLFGELGRADWESLARANRSHCLRRQGELGQARREASEALNLARGLEHPGARLAYAWDTRAEVERACGRWEEAAEAFGRAVEVHRATGRPHMALRSAFNRACSLLEGGALPLSEAQEALDRLAEVGEVSVVTEATLELAMWSSDPAHVAALVARVPHALPPALAQLRALALLRAGLDRRTSLVEEMAMRRCPEQALACAVLAQMPGGEPWKVRQQAALDSLGEGLLSTQRRALEERVGGAKRSQ
ncbi:MAG: hypothetical protein VX899_22890 [Myxococcota bacterium]|nr:hypothetical protein [Myxococcota bacterium]